MVVYGLPEMEPGSAKSKASTRATELPLWFWLLKNLEETCHSLQTSFPYKHGTNEYLWGGIALCLINFQANSHLCYHLNYGRSEFLFLHIKKSPINFFFCLCHHLFGTLNRSLVICILIFNFHGKLNKAKFYLE